MSDEFVVVMGEVGIGAGHASSSNAEMDATVWWGGFVVVQVRVDPLEEFEMSNVAPVEVEDWGGAMVGA